MLAASKLFRDDRFKHAFDRLLERHLPPTFPALCICVIHQGETLMNQAWGWLDPQTRKLPLTPETLFDLASVTKIIVETSFLTLVEAGKIQLESRLVDVIPEFGAVNPRRISGGQDPNTREHLPADAEFRGQSVDVTAITFKHLLTHSSGLPPWCDVYSLAGAQPPAAPSAKDGYDSQRWQKALHAITAFPFAAPVGRQALYSDIGIMLLGEAVSRLHGSPLDKAIDELVIQPLGLSSLTYNPILHGVPKERIVPTEMDRGWRRRRIWGEAHDENAAGAGGVAGHAGLFANAGDVARFGQAWLSGDSRLNISMALRRDATRRHADGQFRMGLGWMLKAFEDSSAGDLYSSQSYGHTGFTGASLWIDPQQDIVTAVLTNRVYHGRQAEDIHAFRRAIHDLIVTGIRNP